MSSRDAAGLLALVADGESDIRKLLATLLRRDGYEVVEAVDGEQAMQLARERLPDVALMDVRMPKLDGYEATRALRADPATRDVKVVILTTSVKDSERASALAAGADLYLRKPFHDRDLTLRVREVLGRAQPLEHTQPLA